MNESTHLKKVQKGNCNSSTLTFNNSKILKRNKMNQEIAEEKVRERRK